MHNPLSGAHMRLFIAIPLPQEEKKRLLPWMDEAQRLLPFKRWVHPEDLHITLQFLGEASAALLPQIKERLAGIGGETSPFSLTLTGTGTFGRRDFPRVLWAGLGGDLKSLTLLHDQIIPAMKELRFHPEERPYSPHLTLARHYKEEATPYPLLLERDGFLPPFPASQEHPLPFPVKEITLFRTHFGKSPMYETVAAFPLTPSSSR